MRKKSEEKRLLIRDATIQEVVESGLAGASIAKIAARAGLSQGTIYLYYPTKDELFRQIYLEIKHEMRDMLMDKRDPTKSSAENIRTLWFALLDYAISNASHYIYAEYLSAANFLDEAEEPELQQIAIEMRSIIQTAIDDGTLMQVPYESLQAVLVAPVSLLSRRITISKHTVSNAVRESTFELIWQGIVNR